MNRLFLKNVQQKTVCLPIGVPPILPEPEAADKIRQQYGGKKIVFSLGRLVAYKGFTHLVEAARFLKDDYVVLIGGTGALEQALSQQIKRLGLENKVVLLGRIPDKDLRPISERARCSVCPAYRRQRHFWHCTDRSHVVRKTGGSHSDSTVGCCRG